MTHLQEELFKLQDTAYRNFHSSLMPGVDKEAVIGVRTPVLRAFAKKFSKTEEAEQFMREEKLHNWVVDKIKHTYVWMADRYKNCDFEYQGWVK